MADVRNSSRQPIIQARSGSCLSLGTSAFRVSSMCSPRHVRHHGLAMHPLMCESRVHIVPARVVDVIPLALLGLGGAFLVDVLLEGLDGMPASRIDEHVPLAVGRA